MAAEMSDHTVRAEQIYQHVRYPKRIRIVAYTPGTNRADVVDAATGKRPRSVLVSELHATGETKSGEPRRTGYRLLNAAELADIPTTRTETT